MRIKAKTKSCVMKDNEAVVMAENNLRYAN